MRQLGMAVAGGSVSWSTGTRESLRSTKITVYILITHDMICNQTAESDAVVGLSFAASPALGADEEILLLLAGELRQASR